MNVAGHVIHFGAALLIRAGRGATYTESWRLSPPCAAFCREYGLPARQTVEKPVRVQCVAQAKKLGTVFERQGRCNLLK